VTNEVSHGSLRRQPVDSFSQRIRRARVSSMPNTCTGAGVGSQRAAAAINARCAVCQDTRYSAATSATARFDPAIARARRSRNRLVNRDRGGICVLVWVNEPRGQAAVTQTIRRLRHHSCTC
jgi:hypothetical protein